MSGLGRGVEKHADRKAGRCALPLLYAPEKSARFLQSWLPNAIFYGYEIEPEWAEQARLLAGCIVTTSDCRQMHYPNNYIAAICTSPTYANRLADHHEARDNSPRPPHLSPHTRPAAQP